MASFVSTTKTWSLSDTYSNGAECGVTLTVTVDASGNGSYTLYTDKSASGDSQTALSIVLRVFSASTTMANGDYTTGTALVSGYYTNWGKWPNKPGTSKTGTFSLPGGASAASFKVDFAICAAQAATLTSNSGRLDSGVAARLGSSGNWGATFTRTQRYTVSYNANGGSGAPSAQTKDTGGTLTLSTTEPTRTGYKFSSWNTAANGSGTTYASGGSYTANADVTLYAQWAQRTLTVNYYSNYATSGSYEGTTFTGLGSSVNKLVYTGTFGYATAYPYGLHNLVMGRTNYNPTGYWGTSTSGGTLVQQDEAFTSGQAMAEKFGKTLASANQSVNIYVQWTPAYTKCGTPTGLSITNSSANSFSLSCTAGANGTNNTTSSVIFYITLDGTTPTTSNYTTTRTATVTAGSTATASVTLTSWTESSLSSYFGTDYKGTIKAIAITRGSAGASWYSSATSAASISATYYGAPKSVPTPTVTYTVHGKCEASPASHYVTWSAATAGINETIKQYNLFMYKSDGTYVAGWTRGTSTYYYVPDSYFTVGTSYYFKVVAYSKTSSRSKYSGNSTTVTTIEMGRLEIPEVQMLSPAEHTTTPSSGAVPSTNIYNGVETIIDSGTGMDTLCYLKWTEPSALNNVLTHTNVYVYLYTEGYKKEAAYSTTVYPGTSVVSLPPADILWSYTDWDTGAEGKSSKPYIYIEISMNPVSAYGLSGSDYVYVQDKQVLMKAACVNIGSTMGQRTKRGVLFAKDPATDTWKVCQEVCGKVNDTWKANSDIFVEQ